MSSPAPDRLDAARRALAEATAAVGIAHVHGANDTGRGPLPTGIPQLDLALGGGLARGRLVEIIGRRSSGRLSLTLALLARTMRAGEGVAFIDAADALDPRALVPDDRARLLWVRPRDTLTALACADLLLSAGGVGLIAVYLVDAPRSVRATRGANDGATARRDVGSGAWARLVQRAERAQASVLVVRDEDTREAPGAFAWATLEVRRHHAARHDGSLLESVRGEVSVRRSRRGGTGATVEVAFGAA